MWQGQLLNLLLFKNVKNTNFFRWHPGFHLPYCYWHTATCLNIQGWKLLVLSRVNMKKNRSWNRCWFYLFSPYLIYQWWCLASDGAVYQHVTGLAFIKFWSTIFVLVLKNRPNLEKPPIRTLYPSHSVLSFSTKSCMKVLWP